MAKDFGLPSVEASVFILLAWENLLRTMDKSIEQLVLQTPNAAEPANEAVQRYREITVIQLPTSERSARLGQNKMTFSKVIYGRKVVDFDITDLPDGEYSGMWGGYVAVIDMDEFQIEFRTEEGIRTPATPCVVMVKDGVVKVKAVYPNG